MIFLTPGILTRPVIIYTFIIIAAPLFIAAESPQNNPVSHYNLKWTDEIKWSNVVNIAAFDGDTIEQRFVRAQKAVASQGGKIINNANAKLENNIGYNP